MKLRQPYYFIVYLMNITFPKLIIPFSYMCIGDPDARLHIVLPQHITWYGN